jgi:hypothetical protein
MSSGFFKADDPLGDGRGYLPAVTAMWRGKDFVLFRQELPPHVVRDYGGAAELWQRYDFAQASANTNAPVHINITLLAFNKTATRITESWWLRFHPAENAVLKHRSMRLDKLGALIVRGAKNRLFDYLVFSLLLIPLWLSMYAGPTGCRVQWLEDTARRPERRRLRKQPVC